MQKITHFCLHGLNNEYNTMQKITHFCLHGLNNRDLSNVLTLIAKSRLDAIVCSATQPFHHHTAAIPIKDFEIIEGAVNPTTLSGIDSKTSSLQHLQVFGLLEYYRFY